MSVPDAAPLSNSTVVLLNLGDDAGQHIDRRQAMLVEVAAGRGMDDHDAIGAALHG